jgi:hypothetical protein
MPDVLTARLDWDTFLSIGMSMIINIISVYYLQVNFISLGLILITLKFIICLFLNLVLVFSPEQIVFETGLNFVVNLVSFLAFGEIFIALLS